MLAERGLRAVTVSIDDVYLTRDEQLRLASEYPGNRYLEVRGYPGTHDLAFGERVLRALIDAGDGERVRVPVYDKGAFDGAGDRAPEAQWRSEAGPFDVVLFEGWMLAFCAVDTDEIPRDDASLSLCNEKLRAYERWRALVDQWVLLEGERVEHVIDWRVESEQKRCARDGRGLSDEQARAYVERFLPAYRAWGPTATRAHGPQLRATLAKDRSVLRFSDEQSESQSS